VISVKVSDNAEVPLACKRNRQDGVSGAPFRTTPVKKYLNTRRVQAQPSSQWKRRPLSNNTPCEVFKQPKAAKGA
jgi:hypothetical protein